MGMKTKLLGAVAIAASFASSPAQSAVVIDIVETGPDVVATGGGTIDLSGLTFLGGEILAPVLIPQIASINLAGGFAEAYRGLNGPTSFGSGGGSFSTSFSGDAFGFTMSSDQLYVPQGYISNSALAGELTFANESFASLGLTPGTYLYTLPSDTITLNIGPVAPVPEPASWALMVLGLGAVGGAMRAARRKSTTSLSCI